MSNSRQFLVPSNYDITKSVYPKDDIVRRRQYLIDELNSTKQYHQNYADKFSEKVNIQSYAEKLRQRATK